MTEKERLTKLIQQAEREYHHDMNIGIGEFIADYMLKNGVIVPPCKIGDTIYVIPSKTNFNLNRMYGCMKDNNRVYEQKVNAIHIYLSVYTLTACDGLQSQSNSMYGETWFLTREEAEKALRELEEK